MNRALSYILAGIAVFVSMMGYSELRYIGFPDGYASEWDNARKALLMMLIGISWIVAVLSIYLGRLPLSIKTGKSLKTVGLMYGAFILAVVIINFYCSKQSGLGG